MRKILARFGYVKESPWMKSGVDMRDSDAVARANRWMTFYNENGGVHDIINSLRRSYFEKVGQLKPDDTASLQALGMADRICREIDGQVREIMSAGLVELHNKEHADRIAALPEAKRRRI